MLKRQITKLGVGVLLASLLSGCFAAYEKADTNLKSDTARIDSFQKMQDAQKKPEPAVKMNNDTYLGRGLGIAIPETENLPDQFSKTITFITQPQPLEEVMVKISKITNIPTGYFDPTKKDDEKSGGSQADSTTRSSAMPTPGQSAPIQASSSRSGITPSTFAPAGSSQAGKSNSNVVLPALSYKGDIKGLFNMISTSFGGSWEFREGAVYFYKLKTKTFQLNAFSGTIATTSSLAVNGTATGTNLSTTLDERRSLWKDVVSNIQGMLSGVGRVTENQSTGTITVTDSPYALYVVEDYMREVNKQLAKQIAISIDVYTLKVNDDAGSRFSMDVVVNDLANKYSMAMTGYAPALNFTNYGQMLATVVDPLPVKNRPSFDGSKAIIQALSTQGSLSLSRSVTGITMNNQPMPVQSTRNQTYVSKFTTTTSSSTTGSTQNSVETANLSTGIAMTVTPTILENNQVLLHYIISLTELNDLTKELIGSTAEDKAFVQLPDVNSNALVQRVALRSGSTLILAGIRKSDIQRETGVGMLAYSKSAINQSEIVVFVITASVIAGVES